MTWKAPEVERERTPPVGGEREQLEAWLDFHRNTLLVKCAGLTGEQLATPSVPPSNLTLLGLVRHMADVERAWFRVRFAAEPVSFIYCTDEQPDADFENIDPATAERDYATLVREADLARAAVAGRSLDETFFHREVDMDLRWVYMHMIEEYAWHNGHADLIRERIDGTTGDLPACRQRVSADSHLRIDALDADTFRVGERNVLGGELEPCGNDPLTGFYRDGSCTSGPEDQGSHTICAVVTAEFLAHQKRIGNDLSTPMPQYRFPGLVPGDRWCVTAVNWLRAYKDGVAAPVILASTHQRALDIVPLAALQKHSVDVPADLSALEE